MKTLSKTLAGIMVLLLAFNFSAYAGHHKVMKKLIGKWIIEAPDAPYGYQEADMEVYKENGVEKVKIITDYDVIYGTNLTVKGDDVTFEFEVENLDCVAKLKYKKDKLTGVVETPEGSIPVTITKKKKK